MDDLLRDIHTNITISMTKQKIACLIIKTKFFRSVKRRQNQRIIYRVTKKMIRKG